MAELVEVEWDGDEISITPAGTSSPQGLVAWDKQLQGRIYGAGVFYQVRQQRLDNTVSDTHSYSWIANSGYFTDGGSRFISVNYVRNLDPATGEICDGFSASEGLRQ